MATIIFDAVLGRTSAWIAGGCSLVALVVFWYLLPLRGRGAENTTY